LLKIRIALLEFRLGLSLSSGPTVFFLACWRCSILLKMAEKIGVAIQSYRSLHYVRHVTLPRPSNVDDCQNLRRIMRSLVEFANAISLRSTEEAMD
jgi:hypothetical protein